MSVTRSLRASNSNANIALDRTCCIFFALSVVVSETIFPLDIVCGWSGLTAQSLGIPSASVSKTSDGILRTVSVIGSRG